MKDIHKILLLAITLFLYLNSYSQTGRLEIAINNGGSTVEQVTVLILKNEVVQSTHKVNLTNNYDDIIYDTLEVGLYTLKLMVTDHASNIEIDNNFEIKENQKTTTYLRIPTTYYFSDSAYSQEKENVAITNNKSVSSFHYSTGGPSINENIPFNSFYEFGFKRGKMFTFAKRVALGHQIGSSINYAVFDENNSISPLITKDREKYFYWNLDFLLFTRFTTYNNKTQKTNGLFLDAGISYNFPIMFRYVLVDGKTKTTTKNIHRYNDFSAIARFGYSAFGLTFEYRLTNFLKTAYPEQPKIKVGLSFVFSRQN